MKEASRKRLHIIIFHLHEIDKSIETESGLVVAQDWGFKGWRWGMTINGYGVSFGVMKRSKIECVVGCSTL